MAEARAGLRGDGELCEVFVLEVVVGIEIVGHVDPVVLRTAIVDILHILGDVGQLIVLVVVASCEGVAVAVVVVTPAGKSADGVCTIVVAPLQAEVVVDGALLGEL